MKQLTLKALKSILNAAQLPDDTIIYIGDDEELNGIHQAFFIQEITDDEVSTFSQGSLTAEDTPNVKRLLIS